MLIAHAVFASAVFVLGLVGQLVFADQQRVSSGWPYVPLLYACWARFSIGIVCLLASLTLWSSSTRLKLRSARWCVYASVLSAAMDVMSLVSAILAYQQDIYDEPLDGGLKALLICAIGTFTVR